MKKLTEDMIDTHHHLLWNKATEQFGTQFRVPMDEQYRISELVRGLSVLQIWQKEGAVGSPVRFLKRYDLPQRAVDALAQEYLEYFGIKEEELGEARKRVEKRVDKWDAFLKWANQNHFQHLTTEQLTEQSGFSYQTTLKFLQESPTFRKVKKGVWEIRDAKSDREAAGK